ncbi:MAG TPA: fibronectin type III-like domain-contianing protein, partial [Flavobacteriaceae bacterium]|nr:fibronectin type III-like domain-contianing protein [Flavobacteriaceae bacterium]
NSFPGDESITYIEGLFVGYRWFDAKNIEPLYPFGYGLSYTHFEFSDIKTNKSEYSKDDIIEVTFNLKNTGSVDGKEVAQLYISKPESSVERVKQELKGFKKVLVKSGESETVAITLPVLELAYYNEDKKQWEVEPGKYILKIGNSSKSNNETVSIIIK